jgi:hypothetical protein
MTTLPLYVYAKSAHTYGFVRYLPKETAFNDDVQSLTAEMIHDRPHAAQITKSFLPHIADKPEIGRWLNTIPAERIGDSQQTSNTSRIVANARSVKKVLFPSHSQVSGNREDSITVC